MSFVCTLFICQAFLFDPLIGLYQVLPLRVRKDLVAMAMKEYSASTKDPALLKPHHQMVYYHIQDIRQKVLAIGSNAVGIFYSLNWLGWPFDSI